MPGDVSLAFELVLLLMFFRWSSADESADTETTDESPQMSSLIGESIQMAVTKKTAGAKSSAKKAAPKSTALGLNKGGTKKPAAGGAKKTAAKKQARAK